MPEEPVSTIVPEIVTVDTGADKATTESLTKQFEDFWAEQDTEAKPAVSAPAAPAAPGPAQETKASLSEPEPGPEPARAAPKPEPLPGPVAKASVPETDDDIDRIEMKQVEHENRPDLHDQFKNIKELWKADRARMRAEAARAAKLEADLAEARANVLTPEVKADYEHAAQIRRRVDLYSDPDFQKKYQDPVARQYQSVLQETVEALPDRQRAMEWAQGILQNYSPDSLTRNWWFESVLSKIPNELERQSVMSSLTELFKLQRERDGEAARLTADQGNFNQWMQEKVRTTQERVQNEIMTEIGEQEKRIQPYLPVNIENAKTKEEREAITAHNERFNKLNEFFKATMQDLSAHGPRAWVRASVEATRAQILAQEYEQLNSELKTIREERDKYKAELDKIAGARRRLSSTSGTPPASGKNNKESSGLSVKDLDIRKAFDNYDWGDSK